MQRLILLLLVLTCVGCFGKEKPKPVAAKPVHHACDEWWCKEHHKPEYACCNCNPRLVAEFKAKGDWCFKHDCPDSQCYVCHPERKGDFDALYEAKYGTKPPLN